MRVYIGGPMTGLPDNNHPAFEYAMRRLMEAGIEVISPHLLEANALPELKESMTQSEVYRMVIPGDIAAIASTDGMVLIQGWEKSPGTAFERHACDLFKLPVFAPAYTSDEFPGGAAEWMDVIIDMITEWRIMDKPNYYKINGG